MRLNLIVLLTVVAVAFMGCSGGGGMPLTPTIPGGDTTEFGDAGNLRVGTMPDNGNFLWGYWQGSIDLASSEIELTQMRQAEFHANLASVLQNHPLGLSYEFKGFDMIEKAVEVDVTLTHPFPNSDFRGFDARGIFMGPGNTITSQADPGVIFPAVDGTRVLNADGYTRWWNAVEFTTAGMFGYDDPTVVPDFLIPETTLNPYKYFADCLAADDPIVPNVNTSNRGTFSTEGNPPSVTRRYKIAFPSDGGYMKFIFHYAVDVSWAAPANGTPAPKPIENFPPEANCPEAYHIAVDTTGSTAFYKNETERGGDLQLAIEVFDWQADDNPLGIDGEIESIWLESETLFDTYYGTDPVSVSGSMTNSGIFNITIPNVTPTGLDDQEVLITIRTNAVNNTYAPPMSGPAYPEGVMLAAYALVEIPVSDIEISDIHLLSPNGDEILMAGAACTIKWETSQYAEIENISILLSTNSGVEFDKGIALNIANTGDYIFYDIPETYIGCHNRIKILDTDHPSVFDESDTDFTILPQLEDQILVTGPNGGEEWIAGTSEDIKWVGDPNIPNVAIKLSEDMGQTWPFTIVESTPNSTGVFNWGPISQEYIGPNCRIGVFDTNSPSIFDISDANFSIAEPGIELLTPNGGEVLEVGNAYEITWKASDIISNILIEMSSDSGGTYPDVIIGSTPNTGGFTWDPIDDWPETFNARVKISDADNPGLYNDESDGDFIILERNITLEYPNGGQEWRIGFPQAIDWSWAGNIPLVDITMAIDGGGYDAILVENEPNTGTLDIASFFPPSLTEDHTIWTGTEMGIGIKVAASDDPVLNDSSESDITVPLTLDILNNKNCTASGDTDDDGVKNEIEMMLAMVEDDFDSDRDGMFDFGELFPAASWVFNDTLPDGDGDGDFAPVDTDDNADGIHDGEMVDSDNDGVPNYLEYYGYTYNWLTGEFGQWEENNFTVDYFKTDPMQPSSDQDPYGDGMEVSGLLMDPTVMEPGDSPMVPACPNIKVSLKGYEVTLNADIEDSQGHSESKDKSWERGTEVTDTYSSEAHWEATIGATTSLGIDTSAEVSVQLAVGASLGYSNSVASSTSTGETVSQGFEWSTARSYNPTEAAKMKLYLKVENVGTACASNIVPTITLAVGRKPVKTFIPGGSQINLLPPDGQYPPGDGNYWVVDSDSDGNPIFLTQAELKAFETGVPISISVPQMQAQVAAMNDQGYWDYVGEWGEYMARVDAVSANIHFDGGDGSAQHYKVYADDSPSAPVVKLGDALIWATGAHEVGNTYMIDYRLADGTWTDFDLEGCYFTFDQETWDTIQDNMVGSDIDLMQVPLFPGAAIIGKAPPDPPFDEPQIHWAGYDGETNVVLACVTDYFEVESVHFVDVSTATEYEMTYDYILGCYKVQLPGGFVLQSGVDNVYAVNVMGYSSSVAYEIKEMPDPPPLFQEEPHIGATYVTVGEQQTNLTLFVSADVTSDIYDISSVSLVSGNDDMICLLTGPATGGTFTFAVDPATYLPDGTEKILAKNTAGFQTIEAVDNFNTPDAIYRSGSCYAPNIVGDHYWDVETNTFSDLRDQYTDLNIVRLVVDQQKPTLQDPTSIGWKKLEDFPYPDKEYIRSLEEDGYLQKTPLDFQFQDNPDPVWLYFYDSVAFRTEEGRYAYFSCEHNWPSSGYVLYFCVYSLYEGLGQ